MGGGGGVCSSKNSPHLSLAFLSLSLVVYSCLRTTESLGGGGGGGGGLVKFVIQWLRPVEDFWEFQSLVTN